MDAPEIGTSAPLRLPPYTVLGYRADGRPIHPIAGGSGEDDDVDIDVGDDTEDIGDVDTEEDNSEDEQDEAPKPKPPATASTEDLEKLQTELGRTRAALKKSNDEAKRHRLALKEREARDRETEGDHERAIREATEAVEKQWKPKLIKQTARAALIEAGAAGSPERLLKLLDMDALNVDDDGDVVGLESEVDRLKDEFAELFARPEPVRPKARPTGAPKPPPADKPKSSWERHAAALRGR